MISVADLSFRYPGSAEPAVRGLDFRVEEGEIFGFLGPSGAGKSTTQKILSGLLRDFSGRVAVLGRDLSTWGPELYEQIGVSFDVPTLYLKLTGLENLRYFRSLYQGETAEPLPLLERLGLAQDAGLRASQYSKGMKTRLGFARALLNRPRLLFLDEPTAGLDPVNAQNVKEIVREQREEGRTVFLTTHDMSVADQLCDRVAFMVDGRLACIDAPRRLKREHGQRAVRVEYASGNGLASREFPLADLGRNDAFLDLLRRERVETIHTQETTLERVFIDVTGRQLT